MKKLISLFMSIVMLLSVTAGLELTAQASTYSVGDTVTFGSYPQSRVTDSTTISVLLSSATSWTSYNYYNDGEPSDIMYYSDVTYNGEKYRGVKISENRLFVEGGTIRASTSFQSDNGYSAGVTYWFKYEPITWNVLDSSSGLIMSNLAIDCQAYNNTYNSVTSGYLMHAYIGDSQSDFASEYAISSVREWLNNDFYSTAFSDSEKACITQAENLDNHDPLETAFDYDSTNDNVFLLSVDDLNNSAYGFTDDASRMAKSTDYAKAQGAYSDSDGYTIWSLRSPCTITSYSSYNLYYFCHRSISASGSNLTYEYVSENNAIRPALQLNFTSYDAMNASQSSSSSDTSAATTDATAVASTDATATATATATDTSSTSSSSTTSSTSSTSTSKPKKTSIKKVTSPKKKQIKVTWNKKSSVTGYQVQYATNKKFTKNKKTVTIKKASTTSKTIKGLKSKKTYYVRVRTYKTVNGKKIYSNWSTVKKVTTK